ncbi:MAG: hemolysin family protein, partial [Solirubrobacterales bacterium]
NGFFVAVEFSLARARSSLVDELVEEGVGGAKALKHGVDHLDKYLSACQLGITICSIGLGITAEPLISHALEEAFGEGSLLGIPGEVLGFIIAYSIVSMFHVVLGELAPKSLAIVRTIRVGLFLMPPMRIFYILTRPVVDFFNYLGNLVLRPFGIPPPGEAVADPHSEAELKDLIAESQRRGLLDPEELRFAEGVFSFGDHRAREVMVPRAEVVTLDCGMRIKEAALEAANSGHRRFPLCGPENGLDDPVGMINLTDMVRALASESDEALDDLARPLLETPDGTLLDDLLEYMRDEQRELALVRDEHGTAVGVIAMEDVIEMILGDIRGELDPPREMGFERTDEGVRADGDARLDDLSNELSLDPGEIRAATIGGWLVERYGRAPEEGESVQVDDYRFEVLAREGARIAKLMISREPEGETDGDSGDSGDSGDDDAAGENAGDRADDDASASAGARKDDQL